MKFPASFLNIFFYVAHILHIACEEIERRKGRKISKLISKIKIQILQFFVDWCWEFQALDYAGPLIQEKYVGMLYDMDESVLDPNAAEHTVAVYTDPGAFGWKNFKAAKVNILVNPNSFDQPGGKDDHVYGHIFATALTTAMSSNVTCPGDKQDRDPHSDHKYSRKDNQMSRSNKRIHGRKYNLNYIYNHIEDGTYNLHLTKCYPYCC